MSVDAARGDLRREVSAGSESRLTSVGAQAVGGNVAAVAVSGAAATKLNVTASAGVVVKVAAGSVRASEFGSSAVGGREFCSSSCKWAEEICRDEDGVEEDQKTHD